MAKQPPMTANQRWLEWCGLPRSSRRYFDGCSPDVIALLTKTYSGATLPPQTSWSSTGTNYYDKSRGKR